MPEILSENTKASKTSDIDVNMFIEVLGASPCFACIRPKNELELGFCEEFEAQKNFFRAYQKKGFPEVIFIRKSRTRAPFPEKPFAHLLIFNIEE